MIHKCPSRLDDQNTVTLIDELWEHSADSVLTLDFAELDFALPFATLLFAESFRELLDYRRSLGLKTLSNVDAERFNRAPAVPYLKHMGFFKFVNMAYGKEPNEAPGSENYIPIRILTRDELCRRARGNSIQEAIAAESMEIAGLILDDPDKCAMLAYCFQEVIRNVFEHADIDYCSLMGQKWNRGKYKGVVEIAIIDQGRGIFNSIREAYELSTVEEALRLALKPGTSRVAGRLNDEYWGNTGFGLYVLSQLGIMYGEFSICSNGKLLEMRKGYEALGDIRFGGTAVKLRVNTQHAEYFPNALEKVVREGERLADQESGKRKSASKSSDHLT